jgi:hypothetical protein
MFIRSVSLWIGRLKIMADETDLTGGGSVLTSGG